MLIKSLIVLLCWVKHCCYSQRDTWFNLDELRKEWVKEGYLEDYTPEEKDENRKAKREMESFQKYNEYLREGMMNQRLVNGRREIPTIIHARLDEAYIKKNKEYGESDLTWHQKADLCDVWLYHINFVVEELVCYPTDSGMSIIVKHRSQGDDVWKFLATRTAIEELSWDEMIAYPSKENAEDQI